MILKYIERLKKLDSITDTIIEKFRLGIKKKITMYEKNVDLLIKTFSDILKKNNMCLKNLSGKYLMKLLKHIM